MQSRPPPSALMLMRHGMATLCACMLITAMLTLANAGFWDVNLVFSLAIGFFSWVCIETGRHVLSRHQTTAWPHGWRGVALVLASVLVGFGMGSWIGNSYLALTQPATLERPIDWRVMSLFITLLTSTVMSVVFYLINKSRHLQTQATLSKAQADQARLALLQTQLEPHMLFNTLANLQVLIAVDPERAQRMLDHLIDYLRATLGDARRSEHSLGEEFARLQDYLALMQIRMGSRLAFTLDLAPELIDVKVPPLLLQPLVENSIRHGLEPQLEGGSIVVTALSVLLQNGVPFVEIRVDDSGCGLASPDQSTPGSLSPQPDDSHLGVALVRERLATCFGAAARCQLTPNSSGQGCTARVLFPLGKTAS